MSVTVTWAQTATIEETLPTNTDSAPSSTRRITHTEFNEGGTLDASSTPAATKQASFVKALSSGAGTIDLTALTGTNGAAVDGTGLRVQLLRVKNLGAAALTIEIGDSNGYDGLGAAFSVTLIQNAVFEIVLKDAGSDISGSKKTLDLTGTGAQTSEWTVVMG